MSERVRIALTTAMQRSPLDSRRGIVRIHRSALDGLGASVWDPIVIHGERVTGALAALSPQGSHPSTMFVDDLTCANAGIVPGSRVEISLAEVTSATEVTLGVEQLAVDVDPFAARFALLGKVLFEGDKVSLLPQDFVRQTTKDGELEELVGYFAKTLGEEWRAWVVDVTATEPPGLVRVTMETIVLSGAHSSTTTSATTTSGADDQALDVSQLPGHEEEMHRLRELFELGFHRRDLLEKLGTVPQMGVLLTGPPGSGKVAIVRSVAAAVGAKVIHLWGPALARLDVNDAAAQLRKAFETARASVPAVVLIEDVSAIAPRREARPLLSVLAESISETARLPVAIVCTTAHPEDTDPDLRAPGFLELEIALPLPDLADRQRILEVRMHGVPLAGDVKLEAIAKRTPGFVAADLLSLCREASMRAAQRAAQGKLESPSVSQTDLDEALDVVRPSSMEGVHLELANVALEDVGDMENTKKELEEAIIWPLRYPDTFERMGIAPPRGVLLYGPPGCGKTFLMKALAHEAEANFFSIKGAELLSMWVGESERGVRDLFRKARGAAPSILFFDELDALAPQRGRGHDAGTTDRVVAQLLTEMDGVEELRGVSVVGATNRPDLIDRALLRPGRLERLVFVAPPDTAARAAILRATTKHMPLAEGVDLTSLAARCEGYSAADLAGLARQAALAAMREGLDTPQVGAEHFERSFAAISPSVAASAIDSLRSWADSARG